MDKRLFERLVEGMQQHEEIRRGERTPSREFFVDAEKVKEIRAMTGSASRSSRDFSMWTSEHYANWEQGRRQPTGPARALLRAIKRDPKSVLKALAA
jgi:putative transcriptional regulator